MNSKAAPQDEAQAARGSRIPLPTTKRDDSVVALPPSVQGLFTPGDGPFALSPKTESSDAKTSLPSANNHVNLPDASNPAEAAPTGSASTAEDIEPWPYSPDGAKTAQQPRGMSDPIDEFDSVPPEEYRAAVAKIDAEADPAPLESTAPQAGDVLPVETAGSSGKETSEDLPTDWWQNREKPSSDAVGTHSEQNTPSPLVVAPAASVQQVPIQQAQINQVPIQNGPVQNWPLQNTLREDPSAETVSVQNRPAQPVLVAASPLESAVRSTASSDAHVGSEQEDDFPVWASAPNSLSAALASPPPAPPSDGQPTIAVPMVRPLPVSSRVVVSPVVGGRYGLPAWMLPRVNSPVAARSQQ